MPDGWRSVSLGELFQQESTRLGVHDKEPPVLSLSKHDGVVLASEYFDKRIASTKLDQYKILRPGEFAYSTIHIDEGSIGRNNLGITGVISPMYKTMLIRSDVADPRYLENLLRQPVMLEEYRARAAGTVNRRRSLSFRAFSQIEVLLPPPAEQRRIVDLLDSIHRATDATDAVVRSARKACARLRDDLISGATQKLSELLLDIDGGLSPVTQGRPPVAGERAVLKLSAIRSGRFLPDESKAIPPGVEMPQKAAVRAGDVLITRSNTADRVGDVAFVDADNSYLFLSDLILRLHPRSEILMPTYLAEALLTSDARSQIEGSARGTSGSMKKISRSLIRTFEIPVPPVEEQEKIVALVGATRNVEAASAIQSVALRRLRSSVLDGLVSGKHVIPSNYDELIGLPR